MILSLPAFMVVLAALGFFYHAFDLGGLAIFALAMLLLRN